MKFATTFIITSLPFLAVGAVIGRPVTIPITKRSKNGLAPRNQIELAKAKILRGFEAYRRNTGAEHRLSRVSKLTKRAAGNVALTADGQQLWYGAITVGTPAVTYTVDFDTGSSDLFLPGSLCGQTCSGHTMYNTSSSSTAFPVGKNFNLTYGDGSTVSGMQYTDTVSIAGLTVTNQTLGAAKIYSQGFQSSQFPADGLMGMGFKALSDYNADPVFQTLVSQRKTTTSEFAFKLSKSGAELTVGGVDSSKFTGSFSYAPVTEAAYWEVSIPSVKVGSQTIASNVKAIIDSGTTLVIGDSKTVATIYKSIPGAQSAEATVGQGYYSFPCSTTLPSTIGLTFGNKTFTIAGSTLNAGPIDNTGKTCLGGFAAEDSMGFWIVGDVFMQNVYTVFDVANEQVGFATLA